MLPIRMLCMLVLLALTSIGCSTISDNSPTQPDAKDNATVQSNGAEVIKTAESGAP